MPSNTPIMQTLQDFNLDLTSYVYTTHIINAFFVKNDYASAVSWLKDITSFFLSVIIYNNLFHHATLWIPRTHLPNSIKDLTRSSPRRPLRSHYLVCNENHLFIVGIGPIRDKEL